MKKIYFILFIIVIIGATGYFAYSRLSNSETFEPGFPDKFDALIIENANYQWTIQKNDKVDEFIKKSKRISVHIGEGREYYVLRFLSEDSEVFTILYDEIGYPESAVKVMNEIMRENKVGAERK